MEVLVRNKLILPLSDLIAQRGVDFCGPQPQQFLRIIRAWSTRYVAIVLSLQVTVTVEGRKVVVRAKHDESTGGRKVHNEMTKSFDLPPSVDANNVRSYIKDGTTLYIEAHLRDDLVGKIHLVPVTHK